MSLGPYAIVCGAGYVSGKEIMVLQLARGLQTRGVPIELITSSWSDDDFAGRLDALGLPHQALPIGFISATLAWKYLEMTLEQVWRWPGLLRGYSRFLTRQKPVVVVHSNWHHVLLLLPFLSAGRDVLWLHEILPAKPQYRRVFRWIERRVALFVCVSNAVARSLGELGVSAGKIRVVRNGIDDPAAGAQASWSGDDRSGHRALRVGIVGQIGNWKGHEDLIDAAALLHRRGIDLEFHIIGTGEASFIETLRQRARRLDLEGIIKWRGFMDERSQIYRNLDACVVPSRFEEPFGLTALEPGFFEVPVVATRRGGLPEIVEHEVTGLLVDAESPEQLAASLLRLLENPELRRSLGSEARKRARSQFSSERFVSEFLQVLGDVGNAG